MTSEEQNTMNKRLWSNKKIIKFIKEVHMRPELWNVSVSAYRDRKAKFNAWSAVAAQFNITPDVAYKKFRNLRTYAQTEHKKKGGKQITWFAYDAISFILSVDGRGTGVDSENSTKTSITEHDDDDSPLSDESSDSSEEPQIKMVPKKEITLQPPKPIERSGSLFNANENKERNSNISFGEYVANKLNTYDDYTRAQAEFKISKILFDADMGMFRHSERQFPPQFATIYPNYSEPSEMSGGSDLKTQCDFSIEHQDLQGPSNNRS
ncbi:uncharacterized protein LOC123877947 [Maniola jurtina]|uniref:uncharacterized protein LOC123877947 n=1 Tax=Maniola jurtina TaxID=191418 RepID=UPI001E68C5B0|nr:uncharacterized protein LOC123877947 [Maniola jurtina]